MSSKLHILLTRKLSRCFRSWST